MNRNATIISDTLKAHRSEIKELSKWIFAHPETALLEVESCKYLADFFRSRNFAVEETLCGLENSFSAKKINGKGQRVCLLIEYDALPGLGHACGHHLIAASCAATALALAAVLDAGLSGEVAVIGAPAEETGQGKPVLADGGVYNGYDAAMSLHPYCKNIYQPNWISIGGVDFHFTGRATHAGGSPELGVNALDALILFNNGVGLLRQQLRDGTRIHGMILEGGTAANIIPDSTKMRLEFRSPDANYFDEIVSKVVNCAKGAALATGCELEWHHYEPTCCGVIQSQGLTQEYAVQMQSAGLCEDKVSSLGSTDVGNVSVIVPTIHPLFKITDLDCDLHTETFRQEASTEKAFDRMMLGAEVMAKVLLRVLEDAEFADSLRQELKA